MKEIKNGKSRTTTSTIKEVCIYSLFTKELESPLNAAIGRIARKLFVSAKPYDPADYSEEDKKCLMPKWMPEDCVKKSHIAKLNIRKPDGDVTKEELEAAFPEGISEDDLHDRIRVISDMGTLRRALRKGNKEIRYEGRVLVSHTIYDTNRGILFITFNDASSDYLFRLKEAIKSGEPLAVNYQHKTKNPDEMSARKIVESSMTLMNVAKSPTVSFDLGNAPGCQGEDLVRMIRSMAKITIKNPGAQPVKTTLLSDVGYDKEKGSLELWFNTPENEAFPYVKDVN